MLWKKNFREIFCGRAGAEVTLRGVSGRTQIEFTTETRRHGERATSNCWNVGLVVVVVVVVAIVIPILFGVPAALVRVVPGVIATPATLALGTETLPGLLRLWAPLSMARDGAVQLLFRFLKMALTVCAIIGACCRGAERQDDAQRGASNCEFSVICVQRFLLKM
jgi:hypothetical protein